MSVHTFFEALGYTDEADESAANETTEETTEQFSQTSQLDNSSNSSSISSSSSSNEPFTSLCHIISQKNLTKFSLLLNKSTTFKAGQINPKVINDILLKCISISNLDEASSSSAEIEVEESPDGCEFIELLMYKLYSTPCYFVCWDVTTCKSICRLFLRRKRQFTPYTMCFLLRANDVCLIGQVIELNLLGQYCNGDCRNWHLMFVASYQERFFSDCFKNFYEGLVARVLLLCRLRCSLEQKRYFLTWFAGSLHLYSEEYFLNNKEASFKQVIVKLFESLILNGLLSQLEFKSLFHMLVKRIEDIRLSVDKSKYNRQQSPAQPQPSVASKVFQQQQPVAVLAKSCLSAHLPELNALFPLSLKNRSRLAIKQHLTKYTKEVIDKLNLPPNLKRFLFFEAECESALSILHFLKDGK